MSEFDDQLAAWKQKHTEPCLRCRDMRIACSERLPNGECKRPQDDCCMSKKSIKARTRHAEK